MILLLNVQFVLGRLAVLPFMVVTVGISVMINCIALVNDLTDLLSSDPGDICLS